MQDQSHYHPELICGHQAGYLARTTTKLESRGSDGSGGRGPGVGFDHGVFVPFRLMFGEEFTDIPIVEVSMDGSLDPVKNWAIGQAVKQLRWVTLILNPSNCG